MSDLFSRAMEKEDTFEQAELAVRTIKSQFPYLHDVLAGSRANGSGVARAPGSLRLFTNAGALKAEISGRDWIMRGYLVLPEGVLSIEAIEETLKSGKIGWSVASEPRDSSRKPAY